MLGTGQSGIMIVYPLRCPPSQELSPWLCPRLPSRRLATNSTPSATGSETKPDSRFSTCSVPASSPTSRAAAIIAGEERRWTQQPVHQLLPRRGERVRQRGTAEHMPGKLRSRQRLATFVQQVARAPQERSAGR